MILRTLRALQELGLLSLSQYGLYDLALRSGYYRWRLPIKTWSKVDLSRWLKRDVPADPEGYAAYRNELILSSVLQLKTKHHPVIRNSRDAIETEANAITQGRFRLFGIPQIQLGDPPDWHAFAPLTETAEGTPIEERLHWSQYNLQELPDDVKLLWEPSRFGWVYPLAQAYTLGGDERFFESFWRLYTSWLEANPPQVGLHWYSAQEVAIRLIALIFAALTFSDALGRDHQCWLDLLKGIVIHAERIPPSLSYAKAQNNNHLLLESAALYLVGVRFPELRTSDEWKSKGRRQFEAGISGQVFPDGGYVQHSTNYQRLALQAGILVARVAREEGEPLEESTLGGLGKMAECLASLVDEESGLVPNFGPNDGAMLLPISTCPFEDFRPTIQAAWQMLWGERRFPAGSWDDLSIWLGVDTEGILAPEHRRPKSAHFPQAGLFITQANDLKTVLRAVDFRNRPGHSDQLHMDIWYQGVNLARDPGTYLYNAQPPWDNSLSGAWCHNTVGLDHREPMLKAGRFLWLDWSRADVIELRQSENSLIEVFFACHRSGRWSGSLHQRTVAILGKDLILVADDILGKGEHDLILNWSLADLRWQIEGSTITLQHENFLSTLSWSVENRSWGLYRAGEGIGGEAVVENPTIYGWHAPTYAQKMPGLQLVVQTRQMLPARMISTWTFQDADLGKLHVNWLPIEEKRVAFDSLQWGSEEWVS